MPVILKEEEASVIQPIKNQLKRFVQKLCNKQRLKKQRDGKVFQCGW
jgi:hypothetical protein